MTGIDRHTGKPLQTSDHIRQSIEVVLTTPVGSRVMRRDFGYPHLGPDGRPKPDIGTSDLAQGALDALRAHEPRAEFISAEPDLNDIGILESLKITYIERKTGKTETAKVVFGSVSS